MRLNKYIALATGLSRRAADVAIEDGRVTVNGTTAKPGFIVHEGEIVFLDGKPLSAEVKPVTLMMNKPRGYVSSREGQGSMTIYDLLPIEFHNLKSVGRLDKDSSGLLLLTNNGNLAHQLTHPSFKKEKVYEVKLDRPLADVDYKKIMNNGVDIGDGKPSKLQLARLRSPNYQLPTTNYLNVTLAEGRNRQIRKTFDALGYKVTYLHRTRFGAYELDNLKDGKFALLDS